MKRIATEKAPAAVGPYSQAIQCGDFLFCSGQIGLEPATGEFVGPGLEEQTRRALANLAAVLAEAGLSPSHVVKTTVFLQDMGQFAAMNAIYAEFFGEHRPARSAVEASGLPKGAVFEIEAIAHAG